MQRQLDTIHHHLQKLDAICKEAQRRYAPRSHFHERGPCLVQLARESLGAIRQATEALAIDSGHDAHHETCRRMFRELTAVR